MGPNCQWKLSILSSYHLSEVGSALPCHLGPAGQPDIGKASVYIRRAAAAPRPRPPIAKQKRNRWRSSRREEAEAEKLEVKARPGRVAGGGGYVGRPPLQQHSTRRPRRHGGLAVFLACPSPISRDVASSDSPNVAIVVLLYPIFG